MQDHDRRPEREGPPPVPEPVTPPPEPLIPPPEPVVPPSEPPAPPPEPLMQAHAAQAGLPAAGHPGSVHRG